MAWEHAETWIVRTKKEDSAFLYAVVEANEGVATVSTLAHSPGDPERVVELLVPASRAEDARRMIESLGSVVLSVERR
ncbi:MAG TPA: hypothetical protein VL588_06595 [Bdellovibrionota bacterium]|jgi:hypothetical protein|nr:hypothetical protein [Bdellovibrionota bacterium]